MLPGIPRLSSTDTALLVAGAGKVFIELADSMPDPGPSAGYFSRWFFGFMQKLSSNGAKAEAARTGGKVTVSPAPDGPKL
jgi:hypothetical protein